MGVLYPDNKHRADRVNQLANEITYIQEQVKQAIQDEAAHDKKSLAMLESTAKKQGFKTFDEYIADVEKQLSPDDRKRYQDMKTDFLSKDKRIDIALKTGIGFLGIGIKTGLTGMAIVTLFRGSLLRVSLQAIGVALLKFLIGQFKEGTALFRAAGNIIQTVFKGELLSGKVLAAFKVFKVVGAILSVLGIALDAITLIYEAIDGAKQRTDFQNATKELCVRRLTTKKIHQYVRTTLTFSGEAQAIIDYTRSLQELVEAGILSQEVADEKVKQRMLQFEPKIKEALSKIDDETVYRMLQQQDIISRSWTNEDPSFAEIEKMIAQGLLSRARWGLDWIVISMRVTGVPYITLFDLQ
ncbi:hypothetical protein AMATHDRAFT_43254 [Amanita thiersii Skay4041]|uniref:Uncharacterized protein n=1 Tax=Amanita thiersii Skay4041 TaxID=703135 RepID=A0A2A9NGV1_9AGAR|nr:hypothetical protein AMATHDRAFT_43254 [Amanita thiersii Skay4041]